MPVSPQDHKKKVKKAEAFREFTFVDADGDTCSLPLASVGRAKMKGRDVRDAAVGGDVGQLAFLFKVLEAADPDPAALDSLYDMPQDNMLQVLNDWAEYGDGDGASLGESSPSMD